MLQPELGRDRTMLGGGLLVDLDLSLFDMNCAGKVGDLVADRLESLDQVHGDFLCAGDQCARLSLQA
jgi:hypothetical protein